MISVSPVGDAGTAALCQLKGVLQLLNGIGVPATTGPVLPSQLKRRYKLQKEVLRREASLTLQIKRDLSPLIEAG